MEKTAYTTIDEYIALFPPEQREIMGRLRETIRAAAPDAREKISYQMPTFWQHENLIHFAANKKHLGLYPGGEVTALFEAELAPWHTSKGAIQFPWDGEIPWDLIVKITRFRVEAAERKAKEKQAASIKTGTVKTASVKTPAGKK